MQEMTDKELIKTCSVCCLIFMAMVAVYIGMA